MVRYFRIRSGIYFLFCLVTTSNAVAEQSTNARNERNRSSYSPAEPARRGHSSYQVRDDGHNADRSPQPTYDRRRAAKCLREISEQVARMKQRSTAARKQLPFDPQRAAASLQMVASFVAEMKQRTRNSQQTVAGPIKDIHIHHYNRRRVPTPDRIEKTTGLTHRELAEMKLREKGYTKTIEGWLPPAQKRTVARQKPKRKRRESIAQSTSSDPF